MARASEVLLQFVLDGRPGEVHIGEAAAQDSGSRAYLDDGRVTWLAETTEHGLRFDAERLRPPPERLAPPTVPPLAFWRSWTAWEVVAKLTGIPIVCLVKAGALTRPARLPGLSLLQAEVNGIVLTIGHFVEDASLEALQSLNVVGDQTHAGPNPPVLSTQLPEVLLGWTR